MTDPGRDRNIRLLIAVGLVLIGLAAGVLIVLIARPTAPIVEPRRSVERVELGRPAEPSDRMPEPDSMNGYSIDPITLNRIFRRVADRVTPAVVYIQVEVPVSSDGGREWFHNFDGERRRFFRENPLRQSVGSGVLMSPEGYIVTNNHVVENASSIQITLSDKRLFDARVVGVDPSTDLAVLKIEDGEELPVVRLGDSDRIQVGEWVIAVGNPFRLTSTVTAGIVSAIGRQVNIIDDNFRIEDFIQTDAAINPGNSGGALVNLEGELVGIATAIATESGSYEGYGFAVPVNLVERVAQDLIVHGEVQRGYLGVTIQPLDAQVARRLGMDRIMGVYVNDVTESGAAQRAGIRSGDVIVTIDGRAVNAPNELQSVVARRRPGDKVDVNLWRRGSLHEVDVELLGRDAPAYKQWFSDLRRDAEPPRNEEVPDLQPDTDVFEAAEWGIGVRELSRRERQTFDVDGGAFVAYVENGSLADAAGIPRDVAVVEINGERIETAEDAIRMLEDAAQFEESLLLHVRRRGGISAFYEMDVPAPAG